MAHDHASSPSTRVPLADHQADVAALLTPLLRSERRALGPELVGRIAAAERRAAIDVPSADNSQMDGFALACADLGAAGEERTLPVGTAIPAGAAPSPHEPGTARPIMTGAPLPDGADLVVPVEEAVAGGFDSAEVTLRPADVTAGRFVRPRGSDTREGDTVLRAGDRLTPARIAHLASVGVRDVEVLAPVRTAVLSTGSEVAGCDETLPDGGAFDANGPGLAAALAAAGADVVAVGRVPDDPAALHARLAELAADGIELLVTSGGVSKGAYEVVKLAAELPGVELTFLSVAMQPGGPQGIGTATVDGHRIAWVALPGNPVSSLLSCELLLRPALGAPARTRLRLPVRVESDEPSPVALEQFRRARLLPGGEVRLAGGPSSHLLGALAVADALVIVPVGVDAVRDGDTLTTIVLS